MISRIAQAKRDADDEEFEPEMPPVENARYLIGYLYEIGPALSGGTGPVALSNQEVASWQTLTNIRLQPWEARFLHRLSRDYLSEMHAAEKRNRKAPWIPEGDAVDYKAEAMRLRNAVRGLANL